MKNYRFFTNSEKTWKAMYQEIEKAKSSIYLEVYRFYNDMEKYNFFKLLKKKAREKIKICIILDSLGSFNLNKDEVREMEKAGIEILFSSSFLHRIHRKILVIDEKIAFIGGVNFHQNTFDWKDLVIKIKNKLLVKKIIQSFVKVYKSLGGKNLEIKIIKNKKKIIKQKLNKTKTWLIEHIPKLKVYSLKEIYKKELDNAKKEIIIVTPYFAPGFWLRKKLKKIINKGVKVKVLIPHKVDHFIPDRANYFYMNKISRFGVNFYIEPFMNHSKAIIIDNKRALIGSQNIDFLSFDLNSEVGIFSKDEKIVNNLIKIIKIWEKESLLFKRKEYKPKWYDYLLSPLMMIFSKIL